MNRRTFLRASVFPAFQAAVPIHPAPVGYAQASLVSAKPDTVIFDLDGIRLYPAEYASLLSTLASRPGIGIGMDTYASGGVVAELENQIAALLGKERAVFFPTGTMANRIALQVLAGDKRRVLLQRESHTYSDEGDGAQRLGGLNLIPLAPGKATFTLEDVLSAVQHFQGGAPFAPVGAISMECPVRRKSGQVFEFQEMQRISAYARQQSIGVHLDGARLFLASAYTGISPARYSELADTVYVSLYKYFNAAGGAILAGEARLVDQFLRLRHASGGLVLKAWPQAAVALHFLDGFERRFAEAVQRAEVLFGMLNKDGRFRIERVAGGTNIAFLHTDAGDVSSWLSTLERGGIILRRPPEGTNKIELHVNETLLRRDPADIFRVFRQSL
jgi:threonine aldolase